VECWPWRRLTGPVPIYERRNHTKSFLRLSPKKSENSSPPSVLPQRSNTPNPLTFFQLTYHDEAPPGFGYIPVGHPEMTEWCKEQCRQRNLDVHIVSVSTIVLVLLSSRNSNTYRRNHAARPSLILKRSLLTFIALVIIFPWRSSIWLAGSSDTNTITAVYVAVGGVLCMAQHMSRGESRTMSRDRRYAVDLSPIPSIKSIFAGLYARSSPKYPKLT
jgi:hypothetical protein